MSSGWLPSWAGGALGDPRLLSALAPVLVLCTYVGCGAAMYAWRNRRGTPFHDEEMDGRDAGGLTTAGLRHFFAWLMRPLWQSLASVRFPPDVITKLSFVIALGASVAVALGRFALGGWLFLASGLLDYLDGRVARATHTATSRGAALDSVLDRYVEAGLLTGLSWYYRHDWVLGAGLLALSGSLLVPYVRARGEALGVKVSDVGFMQRTERVVVLGLGTALSPAIEVLVAPHESHPRYRLAIAALILLAVSAHVSAVQRTLRLSRALGGSGGVPWGARPLKSALVSIAATLVDFSLANTLFFGLRLHGSAATVAGCVAGALVSFVLSRHWAFSAGRGSAPAQLGRYAFASAVSAALNGGGVALLSLADAPFLLAWTLTRLVVFACWSYPVQRDFVFVLVERATLSSSGATAAKAS